MHLLFILLFVSFSKKNGRAKYKVIDRISIMKWSISKNGSNRTIVALSKDLQVIKPVDSLEWTVVEDPKPQAVPEEYNDVGLIGFDFSAFEKDDIKVTNPNYDRPFGKLFKHLWPGDVNKQIRNMNKALASENEIGMEAKRVGSREDYRKKKMVTQHEFWKFIGTLIAAAAVKKGGVKSLWEKDDESVHKISESINFGPSGEDIMHCIVMRNCAGHFPSPFMMQSPIVTGLQLSF